MKLRPCGVVVLVAMCATTAIVAPAGAATERSPIPVVVSFYPLAWAAQQVGDGLVRVENLTPSGAEPHDLELSTHQRDAVEDADVAVVMGRRFQPAVEAAAASRDGVTVVVLDRLDARPGGDATARARDPHVWLDPLQMLGIVEVLERTLAKRDPDHAGAFRRSADEAAADLLALDERYRDGLADCERDTIVTSHEAFGHLAAAYGLREEGVAGIAPDAEPDARRLAQLADLVRDQGVTTVFTEELVPRRLAETLAREAGGVKTVVLSPLETLTPRQSRAGDDYISVMDTNLGKLRAALGCR